jgi:16S rRNA (uracil1498-N3)-methyltransferase
MQSRRPRLATVEPLRAFADSVDVGFAIADPSGSSPSLRQPAIAVGPEGGWSDAELSAGTPRVALGTTVLRSETAAVAACALLNALRVGLIISGQGSHESD